MSAVRANSRTDDSGRYEISGLLPGEYVVEALNDARHRSAFHPSGPAPNNALPITIEAGEELGGIDIRFAAQRLAHVAGRVTMANGRPLAATSEDTSTPVQGFVRLDYAPRPGILPFTTWRVQPATDGSFQFDNIEPGDYVVTAIARAGSSGSDAARQPPREFDVRAITVRESDIDSLTLTTRPTGSITGRIVFEGTARSAYSDLTLKVWQPDRSLANVPMYSRIHDDGTFEVHGVSDRALITVWSAAHRWSVQSVATPAPHDPAQPLNRDTTGVEIVLTPSTAQLRVSIREPGMRSELFLFTTEQRWWPYGWPQPAIRHTSASIPYAFDALPAGNYHLIAVAASESRRLRERLEASSADNDAAAAAFLKQLASRARRIILRQGQRLTLDVPLTSLR